MCCEDVTCSVECSTECGVVLYQFQPEPIHAICSRSASVVSGYIFEESQNNSSLNDKSKRHCFTVLTERPAFATGWIQIPSSQSPQSGTPGPLPCGISMECDICCEDKSIREMVMLDCNHIMCGTCLCKLTVKKSCPFCGLDVFDTITNQLSQLIEIKVPIICMGRTNGFPEPSVVHHERTMGTAAEMWNALSDDQRRVFEIGFLIFSKECREILKRANPVPITSAETARKVADAWHELSKSERTIYRSRAMEQLRASSEQKVAEMQFPTLLPSMNENSVHFNGDKSERTPPSLEELGKKHAGAMESSTIISQESSKEANKNNKSESASIGDEKKKSESEKGSVPKRPHRQRYDKYMTIAAEIARDIEVDRYEIE